MTDERRAALIVLGICCATVEEDAFEAEQLEDEMVALLDRVDAFKARAQVHAEVLEMAVARVRETDVEERQMADDLRAVGAGPF